MLRRCARLAHFILFGGVLLICADCGAPLTSPAPGATAPGSTPTVTVTMVTPTPPGSPASQTITIATDHASYATTDAIKVTVMNHTNVTVDAAPGHASCTILTLETRVNGQWRASDAAPCPTQPTQALVQLRPNIPYQGVIRGLALPYHPRPFAVGEYRLVIAYWNAITGAIPSPNDSNAIISSSFTIH